ncbi:CheY-like superfamily, partial [Chytridium lagenaria]
PTFDTSPSLRILIVDDNQLVRDISSRLLQRLNCNFDVAVDGMNALEKAFNNRYDLILMDIQMPKLDGIGATRAIRVELRDEKTPIISMTSGPTESD